MWKNTHRRAGTHAQIQTNDSQRVHISTHTPTDCILLVGTYLIRHIKMCLDCARTSICKPRRKRVSRGGGRQAQQHTFFFCVLLASLPVLCPLVPKKSLTAEGLSWLPELYYFQHHDQTIQQLHFLNVERMTLASTISELMLNEVTVGRPSWPKSYWQSQAFWAVSRANRLADTLLFVRPLD